MEDFEQQKKFSSKNFIVDLSVICVAVFVGVCSGIFAWISLYKGMSDSPKYTIIFIGVSAACLIYKKRGIIVGVCTSVTFSLLFLLVEINHLSEVSDLVLFLLNSILYISTGWVVGWLSETDFRKKKSTGTLKYPYYVKIPALISIVMMGQFPLMLFVFDNSALPESFFSISVVGGLIGFFIMLGTIIIYTLWSFTKRNRV